MRLPGLYTYFGSHTVDMQTTGNWCSLSSGMATFGTLKCRKLDPILEVILDPILASSWSSSWPPLGAPEGRKQCKNQWFLTLFQISESKKFQNHCILQGLRALGCKMHGRGARNFAQGFKTIVFYKVFWASGARKKVPSRGGAAPRKRYSNRVVFE